MSNFPEKISVHIYQPLIHARAAEVAVDNYAIWIDQYTCRNTVEVMYSGEFAIERLQIGYLEPFHLLFFDGFEPKRLIRIHQYADHLESVRIVDVVDLFQVRYVAAERAAPRRPELKQHTAEIMKLTLEGMKQESIAERMGITLATVKAQKTEGIKKLAHQHSINEQKNSRNYAVSGDLTIFTVATQVI